jgi:hypothetical protein
MTFRILLIIGIAITVMSQSAQLFAENATSLKQLAENTIDVCLPNQNSCKAPHFEDRTSAGAKVAEKADMRFDIRCRGKKPGDPCGCRDDGTKCFGTCTAALHCVGNPPR